ncbi:hypothetical protein FB45DRAFT_216952 [Roridomyces roridus]|uniref:Uncharacterized protein n=1 Tax=Roridomyces roridus TaxID=1738132 RepID=A0AAD7BDJ1_9AGAR|nr:hypothetical protein FB45DRAFT_216952 [Roridomyces roridus]
MGLDHVRGDDDDLGLWLTTLPLNDVRRELGVEPPAAELAASTRSRRARSTSCSGSRCCCGGGVRPSSLSSVIARWCPWPCKGEDEHPPSESPPYAWACSSLSLLLGMGRGEGECCRPRASRRSFSEREDVRGVLDPDMERGLNVGEEGAERRAVGRKDRREGRGWRRETWDERLSLLLFVGTDFGAGGVEGRKGESVLSASSWSRREEQLGMGDSRPRDCVCRWREGIE